MVQWRKKLGREGIKVHLFSRRILPVCLAIWLPAAAAWGCTLFGAQDSRVLGGGSLIVKNRDWRPEYQEMRMVQGPLYRYYGIYGGTENKWP